MKQLRSLEIEPSAQVLKFLSLGLCVAWIGWMSISSVQAQVEDVLPESTPVVDQIGVLPAVTDQIADLKAQYRAELETYRNLDKQTVIANQQYQQLKTLVSLEAAVTSVKKAMVSRVTVLDLYIRLLRLELIQATGVELTAKQQLETEVEAVIADLENHKALVLAAEDRDQLNAVSEQFSELSPRVQSVAYEILAQLSLSRLQSVYDKLQIVKGEVKTQVTSTSAVLQQPAQERAFAETDRNLDATLALLASSQETITTYKTFTAGNYRSLGTSLDKIYTGLSQSLNFLGELAGITIND